MSGKSKALVNVVDQAVAAFDPPLPLAIAFSGGADSSALLLACHARWPGLVRAIHVHHGLQEAADGFQGGLALGGLLLDVGLGAVVAAHPD